MRKNLIYSVFAALMIFFSCSEIDTDLTLKKGVAPVLQSPTGEDREYVLTEENQNNPFETFIYTAADYGLTIAANYTIELDKEGGDFSTPITNSSSTTELFQSISIKDFNLMLNSLLKPFDEGTQFNVQLRISAEGSDPDVEKLYSNVVTLKVTPFDATIPPKYVVGNATTADWTPSDGIEFPAVDVNQFKMTMDLKGKNEGDDLAFRFIGQTSGWGPEQYFFNDFDKVEAVPSGSVYSVTNEYNEQNFQVLESGKYTIEMNLDNDGKKTIKFTKVEE
ncbi:SusE domain-containing protein [Prolixibacteraceae bacterium]|nr:SusE domain-containing protein [Prolixibacteraceae bacterium]